jgi:hypothetical protein
MTQLVPVTVHVPTLIRAAGERAQTRFGNSSLAASAIRIRAAPMAARSKEFLAWYEHHGLASILDVEPLHVGMYIEAVTAATARASQPGACQTDSLCEHFIGRPMTGVPCTEHGAPALLAGASALAAARRLGTPLFSGAPHPLQGCHL